MALFSSQPGKVYLSYHHTVATIVCVDVYTGSIATHLDARTTISALSSFAYVGTPSQYGGQTKFSNRWMYTTVTATQLAVCTIEFYTPNTYDCVSINAASGTAVGVEITDASVLSTSVTTSAISPSVGSISISGFSITFTYSRGTLSLARGIQHHGVRHVALEALHHSTGGLSTPLNTTTWYMHWPQIRWHTSVRPPAITWRQESHVRVQSRARILNAWLSRSNGTPICRAT